MLEYSKVCWKKSYVEILKSEPMSSKLNTFPTNIFVLVLDS